MLLVLDGVGDLRTDAQPRTALDEARTPNLDRLAARSVAGSAGAGRQPASRRAADRATSPCSATSRRRRRWISAGACSRRWASGWTFRFRRGRGPVQLRHRRRGRSAGGPARRADSDGRRASGSAGPANAAGSKRPGDALGDGVEVEVHPGEAYRFVLLFRARRRGRRRSSAGLADTDPQRLGVAPLPVQAAGDAGESARRNRSNASPRRSAALQAELRDEERANTFLLRGFSKLPALPGVGELYRLRAAALAGYPLYRGVAKVCGMEIVDCGGSFGDDPRPARGALVRFRLLLPSRQGYGHGRRGRRSGGESRRDRIRRRAVAPAP